MFCSVHPFLLSHICTLIHVLFCEHRHRDTVAAVNGRFVEHVLVYMYMYVHVQKGSFVLNLFLIYRVLVKIRVNKSRFKLRGSDYP